MRLNVIEWLAIPILAFPVTAATIFVQPPTSMVTPGETVSLTIQSSSVTDLYAFQFDVGFDPARVAAIDVLEGTFLPTGGATSFIGGTINNAAGVIALTADTLVGPVGGVNGGGPLATLQFQALSAGTSAITLSNVTFLDSNLTDISTSSTSGIIVVQSVPEPSSLLAVGLLGLVLMKLAGIAYLSSTQ